ncbi:dGTPase [Proteus cibi]|uniref:dGTPase n=1 Tax=Proteus cibi TaxID=2050966 RepID=UPI0003C5CADB|nr:deoxyguanosinetriphosphate triphosphohydrolase [Proteus hauseri ZMd44]
MIDFKLKLNYQRKYNSSDIDINDEIQVSRQFESDRGRIINSAAIRRLQQKTQVFPLETNSAVRSRLTHSLEVQQIGRYIAKQIIGELKKQNKLEAYGLNERIDSLESLIEMACLMHDIGNPPFGHFGEAAIKHWFQKVLSPEATAEFDSCPFIPMQYSAKVQLNELRQTLRQDLCQFEGNAQAIRMAHHLLKLNLTYAQIGCVLKYTRPAYWQGEIPKEYSYLMKKPGYYWSELAFVKEVQEKLNMGEFCRFPLTYIMEAADDISYCIADLDDAVEKGIFDINRLVQLLRDAWRENGDVIEGDLFNITVDRAYKKVDQNEAKRSMQDQFFMYLRVYITGKLVPYTAYRFIKNLPQVYEGSFNYALLEGNSAEHRLLTTLKSVAKKWVFSHPEVEELEMKGYRVISGLLDIYKPLLLLSTEDFLRLHKYNEHPKYVIETRLYHKLSVKHKLAYNEMLEKLNDINTERGKILEFYYRTRLIQDYISGMTDHYAYEEYRKLMVCD